MTPSEDVTLSRTIAAPREVVFDAWLDAGALARFMCPAPEVIVSNARTDARVGGTFEIIMVVGESELPHTGEYQRIERASRLTFTWRSSMAGEGSVVDIELAEAGDNQTLLTLVHRGLASQEARDNHRGGWGHILETLDKSLPG